VLTQISLATQVGVGEVQPKISKQWHYVLQRVEIWRVLIDAMNSVARGMKKTDGVKYAG
jgi:hypothetical protein